MEIRKQPSLLLITLADVAAYGVRCLASYVKQQGFQTDILCLRLSEARKRRLLPQSAGKISDRLMNRVVSFVARYDIIGISLFSDGFIQSIALTKAIKKHYPDKKIIWGGIHPTLKPHDCLAYADFVCVGEGYYSLVGLLKHLSGNHFSDFANLPSGIWAKAPDGIFFENGSSEMCMDLDILPFPIYDKNAVFVRTSDNHIVNLDRKTYHKYLGYTYATMISQGCPNSCSYCCNYALKKINKGYQSIRKHSFDYTMQEILAAAEHYTFYNIHFMDDSFLSMGENAFEEFVERYPKEIGLPFNVISFIPGHTQQHHIDKLVEAGMVCGKIGVQTGSPKMLEIYHRKQNNEEIIRVSEIFAKHRGHIVPMGVEIILDGYRETIEDTIQTARLISQIKRPFILNLYSLKSYPGTKIAEYMNNYSAGDSFFIYKPSVINNIIALMYLVKIPKGILEFLLKKKDLMNRQLPSMISRPIYYLSILKKTVSYIHHRSYINIPAWMIDCIRTLRWERNKR